jgi:transcriptional regulator with XRE-family HTH domain
LISNREFQDYFATSYEAVGKLAKRIGITNVTLRELLTGYWEPSAQTIAKMRLFLNVEAKRIRSGNGIRSTEPVPVKVVRGCALCFVLGSVLSAEKLGAKSGRSAGSSFKAAARSVERAGQVARDIRRRYERGTVESEYQGPMPKQLNSVALRPIT